jgi:hypothetical protein
MALSLFLHVLSVVVWVGGMFFAPYKKLKRAVAGQDWSRGRGAGPDSQTHRHQPQHRAGDDCGGVLGQAVGVTYGACMLRPPSARLSA